MKYTSCVFGVNLSSLKTIIRWRETYDEFGTWWDDSYIIQIWQPKRRDRDRSSNICRLIPNTGLFLFWMDNTILSYKISSYIMMIYEVYDIWNKYNLKPKSFVVFLVKCILWQNIVYVVYHKTTQQDNTNFLIMNSGYENHAIHFIFIQDVYFKKQIVCVNIDVPM